MKLKKLLPLALLFFSMPVTLASCGESNGDDSGLSLRAADVYNGTYQVGDPIDTDYFFYMEDPAKAVITVHYVDAFGIDQDETVMGHTYYPSVATTYVFSCTVGGKTIKKTVRVEDAAPTLNIDDMPDIEVCGKFLYFADIIAKIAPSYYPTKATVNADRVEFKPLPKSIDDQPAYRIISSVEDGFRADEPGNYRIYCSVENGTKYATGVINVAVLRRKNDGNEHVKVGENGKYMSNNVFTHVGKSNLFTLPKARYAEANYVALDRPYTLGQQVGVRFKGKSIPCIGLSMQESAAGDFSTGAASGNYLTFEYNGTDAWNLKSPGLLKGTNWKGNVYDETARRFEKLGMDDLDDSKYYYLSANLTENLAYTEETSPTRPDLWGKFLHCITWSLYEINDYGTNDEALGDLVMDIFHSGWLDDVDITTGSLVFYSSFYRDITFEVLTVDSPKRNGISVNDGIFREDGTVVLAPGLKTSNGNFANQAATGYVAYEGNYGAGNSVAFEFEGANIPDVCLFADKLSGPTSGDKGLLIGQGTQDPSLRGRTTIYAPYRLDCLKKYGHTDKEHGNRTQSDYATLGNNDRILTLHSDYRVTNVDGEFKPSGNPSPWGRDYLDADKTYLYRVSIDSVVETAQEGFYDVCIGLMLYEKTDSGYQKIAYEVAKVLNYSGPVTGSILAYPEIQYPMLFPSYKDYATTEAFNQAYDNWVASKQARHTTTFKPYAVNGSPLDDKVYEGRVEGNSVTLNPLLDDMEATSERTEDRFCLPYAAVENGLDIGNTLTVDYTGKNIPNICVLADAPRGQAICGGQGFFLATSFIVDSTIPTREALSSANSLCLTPFGPYRWSDDYGHSGWDTKYRYMDRRMYNCHYGILEQEDGVNYRFTLKLVSLKSGILTIEYSVANRDTGDVIDERTNQTFDLKSHLKAGDTLKLGKNLIFYGHGRGITFSYEVTK